MPRTGPGRTPTTPARDHAADVFDPEDALVKDVILTTADYVEAVLREKIRQPAAAWGIIRAELDRRLTPPTEGLAMTATNADPAVPPRRPFTGFDVEQAAYARLKPELLRTAAGKYVVLVGEELVGPVDSFDEALRAGYARFGPGPLYVKQVLEAEPADQVAHDVSPYRPARVVKTPGVCGGAARVDGTRIPVWQLVEERDLGATDARLLDSYRTLTARDLVAAWDYAAAYSEEIAAEIRRNERV
jgi:uncharacterized protein (DUF433 family)